MGGRELTVDHSEMLTTARPPSGRVAVPAVQVSDVMTLPAASSSESLHLTHDPTEHSQLVDEGTVEATTFSDVPTLSEDQPETESTCPDQAEDAVFHQLAAEQLSLVVSDQRLEDPQLEQLENVQVAIKVFPRIFLHICCE